MHERRVTALRLWRRYRTVTGTMVVQVLARKATTCCRDRGGTCYIAVNEERNVVSEIGECFEDVLAARNHLEWVVRCDVCREELRFAGLVLCTPHGVRYQRDRFLQWRKDLVTLWFIVLDEIAALPELVAGIGERAWAQSEFGLHNRADNESPVDVRATENAPHVGNRC